MARKKKIPEAEAHANHERWMLSYADMLTLLLALFIVMFAISQVDQKKFEEFSQGAAQSFGEGSQALSGSDGILEGQPPAPPPDPRESKEAVPDTTDDILDRDPAGAAAALAREKARSSAAAREKAQMEKVRQQIQAQLNAKGLKDAVEFQLNERGLVVNIVTDKVLFDIGMADLRPAGGEVLDIIAPTVKGLPNVITVEGHTDNVPISGQYRSNWELSTARATTVLQHLLRAGVPASRVSAAGYADQRPLTSNKSTAGRARNRRVAVVVLPTVSDTPPGATAGPAAPAIAVPTGPAAGVPAAATP
ncbi:OmpA/MotB family protein [Gephyromycinifex aptenodytis]|uniref:OmpA/MotB family protein n=1 Tax=Gephyromycinifex aptenodytis TaxID=2716227 RepID=UPI00144794BD|nr:flagellar motor protein MotB [Gephyromycinifex aptenodytis]